MIMIIWWKNSAKYIISKWKKRKDMSIFLVPLVLLCSFRVFSSSGDIKNGVMVTKFFLCSKKSDNRVYISYGFCHLLLCSTLMVMASLSSFWVWCRQVIVRLMTKVSRWSTIIFPTIFTSTRVWSEKNASDAMSQFVPIYIDRLQKKFGFAAMAWSALQQRTPKKL